MRKGTRLDGMVNISELSINFVTHKKPKALTGFDQKVRGWLIQFPPLDYRDTKATGEETEPNPSLLIAWNVVNPTLCQ
jgi:hypothetical protein